MRLLRKYSTVKASMLAGLFILLIICYSDGMAANPYIQSERIEAHYAEEAMIVNARYKINLNPVLENALNNGISLPFVYEIEVIRPHWYALYRELFEKNLQYRYRLSFHALTRQYRLSQGSYYRSFGSLSSALSALGILHNWRMLEGYISLNNYQAIVARIRVRLDITQLPRPYQITTLGNSQWIFESLWETFHPHALGEPNKAQKLLQPREDVAREGKP